MKTKHFNCPSVLSATQVVDLIQDEISQASGEQLSDILKIIRPWIENIEYDSKRDLICYSIPAQEIMTWEEEVDDMTEEGLLTNFNKLLLGSFNLPNFNNDFFSLTLADYMRRILKENENIF